MHSLIQLTRGSSQISFIWSEFDGDDCFNQFNISVTDGLQSSFEFGPCVTYGYKKLKRFFSDPTQTMAGLGFRNPDIRYCDIYREKYDYRLIVRFEGNGLNEEFSIENPVLEIQTKFNEAEQDAAANP